MKNEGKIHPVIDYGALNEVMIRERGPRPLTTETLDQLRKANVFTKIDLGDIFNQIRMREGDEWKTAF